MEAVMEKKKNYEIPISAFKEGKVEEIFEEVRNRGAMVVMKDGIAEVIILSPKEYVRMSDDYHDRKYIHIAEERMKNFDPSKLISAEEVFRKYGLTDEDLEGWEEVEFE